MYVDIGGNLDLRKYVVVKQKYTNLNDWSDKTSRLSLYSAGKFETTSLRMFCDERV